MPVQFECPHCESLVEQTKKNRELPTIQCKSCNEKFSTQWAREADEIALKRGLVVSERFETARNFGNKLWNASRFAMMNLDGYSAAPIDREKLLLEDRWILSRLASVSKGVTEALEQYHYSDASRLLYDFAWDEFCSFYVEILKDRLADADRSQAQRLLAFTLDQLLRLLHPTMPFITEEIWQTLNQTAPERGFDDVTAASSCLITASWPDLSNELIDQDIESQFSQFQSALGALREIRSRQNIPPKKEIDFVIKCDELTASLLLPMKNYFASMAKANLRAIDADPEIPSINATISLENKEIFVDLDGLIDVEAEISRLEKEQTRLTGAITTSQKKLGNENFVGRAPPDVVEQVRLSLKANQDQLKSIEQALQKLQSK